MLLYLTSNQKSNLIGVQHLVGVVRFGLVGGGPGKPHEGTQKGISCLLSRGDRRF